MFCTEIFVHYLGLPLNWKDQYTLKIMDPLWLFLELDQTLIEAEKYPVIFCFFFLMPLPVLKNYGKCITLTDLIIDPLFVMLIELFKFGPLKTTFLFLGGIEREI